MQYVALRRLKKKAERKSNLKRWLPCPTTVPLGMGGLRGPSPKRPEWEDVIEKVLGQGREGGRVLPNGSNGSSWFTRPGKHRKKRWKLTMFKAKYG